MSKNGTMKVCVVGLGRFGAALAVALAGRCDVLAIDADMERVNAISDHVQLARCLDVRDAVALEATVSKEFDLVVVSIAEDLAASILCTLRLRKIGVGRIIAKAHSRDHAEILQSVGADATISPEQEHAERLALKILNPNLLDYVPLAGEYRVMDVEAPRGFWNKTLVELDVRARFAVFIVAVRRNDAFIFLPAPNFEIDSGDVLVVMGKEVDILHMSDR
jgi:trk system potassium uptake protein TrkA